MSTADVHPSRPVVPTLRGAARWVRETPAPEWDGDGARRVTFFGYVGVSMVLWTAAGIAGTAVLGEGLRALAALLS